jgi:hypothetical protein
MAAANPELFADKGAGGDVEALTAEIGECDGQIAQLSRDYYSAKLITRPEFFAARDAIQERRGQAVGALARCRSLGPMGPLTGAETADQLAGLWEAAGLDKRRALLRTVIDRVIIAPIGSGRRRFSPERVRIEWRA